MSLAQNFMGAKMDQIITILKAVVLSVGGSALIIIAVTKFASNFLAEKYLEKMKSAFLRELENHKNELVSKSDSLVRKKELYESLIVSMRVFLTPSKVNGIEELKNKEIWKEEFLKNYDKCLLWASDSVINKVNDYIGLQKKRAEDDKSVTQEELKKKHAECFVEMRKDCGFFDTKIEVEDYKFVVF